MVVQGDGSTLLMNFGPPEKTGAEVEILFRVEAQ